MTYRVCDDVRSLASTSQRISLKLEDGRRDTPIRSLWERALFRPPGVWTKRIRNSFTRRKVQ
jgi:uncharacterized Fe-S cluster-containing MiaB family protein